ncbi:MAG TPA: hypothetical protein VG944_12205 [Fimbriimonas sp.]|nr:hypothetical protein [Fimbriimonas sp.]
MYSPDSNVQSNYPRPELRSFDATRSPGVYWDSMRLAFEMLRCAWGTYALGTLLFLGITIVCGMAASAFSVYSEVNYGTRFIPGQVPTIRTWSYVIQALQQVVANVLLLCLISLGVGHIKRGSASIRDFFQPFRKIGNTVVVACVLSLPGFLWVCVSMITQHGLLKSNFSDWAVEDFLVTFLIAAVWWVLVQGPLLVAATAALTSKRPIDRISVAFQRMGWKSVAFGLLYLVATLYSFLGLMGCGIGILFTFGISSNVVALHYAYFFPEEFTQQPDQAAVPSMV